MFGIAFACAAPGSQMSNNFITGCNQQDVPHIAQAGDFSPMKNVRQKKEGGRPWPQRLTCLEKAVSVGSMSCSAPRSCLRALHHVGKDNQGAAQARIGCQPHQEGRCAHEATSSPPPHHPMARATTPPVQKNGPPSGHRTGLEEIPPLLQSKRPGASRRHRQVREAPSTTTMVRFVELRKRSFEGELSLPPFQPFRDQLGGIGIIAKFLRSEDQRRQALRPATRGSTIKGYRVLARQCGRPTKSVSTQRLSGRVRPTVQLHRDKQTPASHEVDSDWTGTPPAGLVPLTILASVTESL